MRVHAGGEAARFEAILEPGGRIVAIAPRGAWPRLLEWQRLVGEALVEAVGDDERPALAAIVADAEPREVSLSTELRFGSARVPVLLSVRRVGDHAIVEGELRDEVGGAVTPERLAQHRLEEIGILSSGIAHDFNNILSAILGNAELLGEALPGLVGPEAGDLLAAVADVTTAAQRSRELIGQMLGYAVKARPSRGLIDLSSLASEMARLLRVSTPQRVVFDFGLQPALPRVEGDASQLRQVVMNLIVNAAEAIGGDIGSIAIRTGTLFADRAILDAAVGGVGLAEGDYVFLEVVDTGCGMDERTVARIFDPFFTTKRRGHGLGLAGVRAIVAEHLGALEVGSSPGLGSTFRVLLPVSRAQVGVEEAGASALPVDLVGRTILVIDDEAIVLRVTRRILEARGARVLAAPDGHEGIELFAAMPAAIDAVLLDVSLPYVDGLDVYKELAMIRADVPVLLISGYSGDELQRRIEGLGVAGFLQKPFSGADLAAALRRVIPR